MKVLHLVIYEKLCSPKNGGMLRCWNLVHQLSKFVELDVLTLQKDLSIIAKQDGYDFPATTRFLMPPENSNNQRGVIKRLLNSIRFRVFYRTANSADTNFLKIIPRLRGIKHNKYDIVIFEHLESLVAWKKIKEYFPSATFIFDAHNVDHLLLVKKESKERLDKIKNLEKSLFTMFDRIFACSDSDANVFRDLNKNKIAVNVIPNGIDVIRNPYQWPDLDQSKQLIFCGSLDYYPNIEGLAWFLQSIWPSLLTYHPNLKLEIVGRGIPPFELMEVMQNEPSIDVIGEVNDVIPYYRRAQVAIVPLKHGSGTRLKILEAMSLGIPIISTSIGAEGINYTEGVNILIADTEEEWRIVIDRLMGEPELFSKISKKGRELVEHEYSWNVIGKELNNILNMINLKAL